MGLIDHVQIALAFKYLSHIDLTCKNDFEIIHFSREHPRWQLAVQKNKKIDCQWIYSKCKMSNFTGNYFTIEWFDSHLSSKRSKGPQGWHMATNSSKMLEWLSCCIYCRPHFIYGPIFAVIYPNLFHDGWCKFARRTRDFLRKCSACVCRLQKFSILGKLVFSLWKQHAVINGFVPVFYSFA